METVIIQELLGNDSYGWIVWLGLLLVAGAVGLSLISKNLITIVKNVKELQGNLKAPVTDYKKQVKLETDITNILRTIRHDLRAERVLVLQYHNGVHSIANNHLLKVSATHEAVGKNTKTMVNAIQAWPSNYLGEWNTILFDNTFIEIADKVSISEYPGLRGVCEFLNAYEVDKMILYPITDSYGDVFGVGMVHLSANDPYPSKDLIKWASQRFYAVGALLAGTQD